MHSDDHSTGRPAPGTALPGVGRFAQFSHTRRGAERWEHVATEDIDPGDGGAVVSVAVFTVSYTGRASRPHNPDTDPAAGTEVVHSYTKRMEVAAFQRLRASRERVGWATTEGDV